MTMRPIRLGWLLVALSLGLWGTSGCRREPSAAEQTANARRQVTEALANFQSVQTQIGRAHV